MNVEDTADRLSGWKEIAQHLRRSVRSAQRWERELSLPVTRVKTAHGQVVYGSRKELDVWMARLQELPADVHDDQPPTATALELETPIEALPPAPLIPSRSWLLALVAVACVLAATSIGWFLPPSASSVAVGANVHGQVVEARSADGRVVWTHAFDGSVTEVRQVAMSPRGVLDVDVDDDGAVEMIVPVRFPVGPNPILLPSLRKSDELYAFTAAGKVSWSVALPSSYTLTCGGERIAGPWQLGAVTASQGAGPKTVWAAFNHLTRWPSFIVEIAPDGRQAIRYVQAGWILGMTDWTTDAGSRLAVVGTMQEQARGSLVVFDPRQSPIAMPAAGSQYACDAPGAVPPSQVTLFPSYDTATAYGRTEPEAISVMPLGARLKVELASGAIVMIDGDNTVSEILFSDEYRLQHDRLSRDGRLDHTTADCPALRDVGEVRTWTPTVGWLRYDLPAKSLSPR